MANKQLIKLEVVLWLNRKLAGFYFWQKTVLMKKKEIGSRNAALNSENQSTNFTGKENHFITLETASLLTRGYREQNPLQHIAEFFGKEAILAILNQPNCVGLRVYYGQEPNSSKKHLVIVGVEPNKNDIYNGFIAERGMSCPNHCGVMNPLNT